MITKITVLIGLFLGSAFSEEIKRELSLNFELRTLFRNFSEFAHYQHPALPVLDDNARLHGATIQGGIGNHLMVGVTALGAHEDSRNPYGYTNWGGGLGTVSIEYRFRPHHFILSPGVTLGCGRYNYAASGFDGTI